MLKCVTKENAVLQVSAIFHLYFMEVPSKQSTAIGSIPDVNSMTLLPSDVIPGMFLLDMEYLYVLDMDSGTNPYQNVKVSFWCVIFMFCWV